MKMNILLLLALFTFFSCGADKEEAAEKEKITKEEEAPKATEEPVITPPAVTPNGETSTTVTENPSDTLDPKATNAATTTTPTPKAKVSGWKKILGHASNLWQKSGNVNASHCKRESVYYTQVTSSSFSNFYDFRDAEIANWSGINVNALIISRYNPISGVCRAYIVSEDGGGYSDKCFADALASTLTGSYPSQIDPEEEKGKAFANTLEGLSDGLAYHLGKNEWVKDPTMP